MAWEKKVNNYFRDSRFFIFTGNAPTLGYFMPGFATPIETKFLRLRLLRLLY